MIPRPLTTLLTLVPLFAAPLEAARAAPQSAAAAPPAMTASAAARPASAASAAAGPQAPVRPGLPVPSPAVRAAQQAQQPGKVRPENAVVPQVAVPLRRTDTPSPPAVAASSPPGPRSGTAGDGVDERAARCLALPTKAERDRCTAQAPK
jgi:hypothetical protein